jgi:hypothetical protein
MSGTINDPIDGRLRSVIPQALSTTPLMDAWAALSTTPSMDADTRKGTGTHGGACVAADLAMMRRYEWLYI